MPAFGLYVVQFGGPRCAPTGAPEICIMVQTSVPMGVDLVDRPRLSPGRHIDDPGCFREILREGRLRYIGVTRHVIPSDPWCWLLPSRGQLSARRRSTEGFRISMITRTPSSYCEQSSRNTDETACNDVAEKMDIHCHESDIGRDNANCP